jgi:hypothetical protein
MPSLTSANVAEAIPKLVASLVLQALEPVFVMANLVNRDYEDTLANYGDVVNVPVPPVLQANNILESGFVQTQNPSLGNVQITLDTHAETTVQIPDVTKALVYPEILTPYMQAAAIAIATKVETDILSNYMLLTANTPVGSQSALSETAIDAAESALFNAYVPEAMPKYLILSGNAYSQARQIPRFTEYQTGVDRGQPSPIQTGRLVGNLKGFTVLRSQLVPKVNGTTFNLAFAKDALSLVMRGLPLPLPGQGATGAYLQKSGFALRVVMSYQPNSLGQQFTVDTFYGTGPLRQNFGVVVQSN